MLPTTVFVAEGAAPLGTSGIECHKEHDKDCGYKEAVEGADCSRKNEDSSYSCVSVSDNTATSCDADKTACTCNAAAEKSAYDKVVELFTALPDVSVINRETTEEEKDAIFARLTAAMDFYRLFEEPSAKLADFIYNCVS